MRSFILILLFASFLSVNASKHDPVSHEITFCGERIPMDDEFVSDKLMSIIKRQIRNVNMPDLRKRVQQYMSTIEYYLDATGLPEDFKYLAIVESGFKNQVSGAGAAGFWQLMPATAREWGLIVNESMDERNDVNKSTHAACKELARAYLSLRKKYGISSWVLTAATYNFGSGRLNNAIDRMGSNYFQMKLNAETAEYVYKIIAVKELFEFPEIYMGGFGYNIFNKDGKGKNKETDETDTKLGSMTVKVNEDDGQHPLQLGQRLKNSKPSDPSKVKFVAAKIVDKYKRFKDGHLVSLLLLEDLQVSTRFTGKDVKIQGRGWIIDGRVMVDLGYDRNVILYDLRSEKGIAEKNLKNDTRVLLKVTRD